MCHRHYSSNADLMEDEDRIIRLPEVVKITGLSSSTMYRKMAAGTFPSQREIADRAVGWSLREVRQWCKNRPAKSPTRRVVSR